MKGRWIRKWKVISLNSGKEYKVAHDRQMKWGCSCPAWIFKRIQCDHIVKVQDGGGEEFGIQEIELKVTEEARDQVYLDMDKGFKDRE